MSPTERVARLRHEARFVFKGTVRKLAASAMPQVPRSSKTAIVRVDEVVEGPPALAHLGGTEITVEFPAAPKLKSGEQAVFYTNGWLFGESIAVRALDVDAATTTRGAAAALASAPPNPVEALRARDAADRAVSADAIVTGHVASVRLPGADRASARVASAGLTPETHLPISEHDPLWREAVVDVDDVQKGSTARKRVVVRFPASNDVRWAHVPKLQPGDHGTFLLHRPAPPPVSAPGGRALAAATAPNDVFAVLHPADFQPASVPAGGPVTATPRSPHEANAAASGSSTRRARGAPAPSSKRKRATRKASKSAVKTTRAAKGKKTASKSKSKAKRGRGRKG